MKKLSHPLLVGLFCWSISVIFSSPPLRFILDEDYQPSQYGNRYHEVFVEQVQNPLYRPDTQNAAWEQGGDFLAYRIFIPTISYYLGFEPETALFLISICGLFTLSIVYDILICRGIKVLPGFTFTLLLSLSPVVQGSHQYPGFPDSVAWLCVAVVIRYPKLLIVFLATLIGIFNDERFLLALPLAYAVIFFQERRELHKSVSKILPFFTITVVALVVSYFLRRGIAQGWVGNAPLTGNYLPADKFHFPFTFWHLLNLTFAFTFLWLVVTLAALKDSKYAKIYWITILFYSAFTIYLCTYAFDYWRSIACLFPVFILSALAIQNMLNALPRNLLLAIIALTVLTPEIYFTGNAPKWMRPLPIALFEYIQDKSILSR